MIISANKIITQEWKLQPADILLVSGGAAWSDHVAVKLHLDHKYPNIHLHLPDLYETHKKRAHALHQPFSVALNIDTVSEVYKCPHSLHNGFFARNDVVAESATHMIAFTWNSSIGSEGGTAYTWKRANRNVMKKHVIIQYARF